MQYLPEVYFLLFLLSMKKIIAVLKILSFDLVKTRINNSVKEKVGLTFMYVPAIFSCFLLCLRNLALNKYFFSLPTKFLYEIYVQQFLQ